MTQINTISKTIRISQFPAALQYLLSRCYSTEVEKEIVIPKRIKRGPTDILKALSQTVNRDPTAPHFKYHDDPFLIPASNYAKRSFALSQESGRKAARWILQEHADLFQHKVADPFIEAFAPKQLITEESDVNIESLSKAMSNLEVTNAVTIYQILEKKNIAIPKEQLQDLLELVSFYNAEDKADEEWIEERWFRQGVKDRARQRKTWKDGGIAESIFLSIDPPDSRSYSALIVGMCTYGQLEKGWSHYEEAKSSGVRLNSDVYCALIRNCSFVREQHDARWTLIMELLAEMNTNSITPNIRVMNAALEALSGMAVNRNCKSYALSTIAEFRKFGVNPSLASYYYLLKIFCRDRTRSSAILVDIMNELEGKTFTIQDPKDTFFFVTAMDICSSHLSDVNLANRINNLLLTGDNYNLIGDSYKESVYLRNYFLLKCEYELFDDFMKLYEEYVPNIYVPEPVVMEKIISAVDMNGANIYLPRLWSDLILFDHITRENLVSLFIETLYRNPATGNIELTEKLADTAQKVWEKIEEQNDINYTRKANNISWTGAMLGQLINALLLAERLDKAKVILKKLDSEQQKIVGVPDVRPLALFVDLCIKQKDAESAIWCVQYCYDVGFEEVQSMGKKIYDKLPLSGNQISRLKTIVNLDVAVETTN